MFFISHLTDFIDNFFVDNLNIFDVIKKMLMECIAKHLFFKLYNNVCSKMTFVHISNIHNIILTIFCVF